MSFPARQGAEGNSRHSDRNISLFPFLVRVRTYQHHCRSGSEWSKRHLEWVHQIWQRDFTFVVSICTGIEYGRGVKLLVFISGWRHPHEGPTDFPAPWVFLCCGMTPCSLVDSCRRFKLHGVVSQTVVIRVYCRQLSLRNSVTGKSHLTVCPLNRPVKIRDSQYSYKRETRSLNHYYRGKAINIAYYECVCSPCYPARNAHAPYCPFCLVFLYRKFSYYRKRLSIFGRKLLSTKCVFLISCSTFSATFLILRRMEKVCGSSKWWEVKDWGESVTELMIVKKPITTNCTQHCLAWVFLPFVHVVKF